MTDEEVVSMAEWLSRLAHGSATNKHNGEPYIRHVERVVSHLIKSGADAYTIAVAWLHDTVEDTWVTLNLLRGVGFPAAIVEAVDGVTHRRGETRLAYYERLGRIRRALAVKLSDLRDNTDPERRAQLDDETRSRLRTKYDTAIRALIPWIIHWLEKDHEPAA